jgi:pimeloyl-ACP methyl ester carboxylesterase
MRDAILAIPVDYDTTEIYSGVVRLSGRTWARAVDPDSGPAPTAFLFVHPTSNFLGHYALEPMARRGMTGVGLTTRYAGNDTSLTFENCVLDIASAIRVLRARGHERVILVGNSGGGGLAAMYQSQAEKPTLTGTPLGDGPDLTKHDLPPVDGLVLLMAHPGRAQVYTEWLDPSIVDESNPHLRLPELDMFNPRNGPPYSPEFVQRYRKAQRERSARIRNLVLARLAALAGMDRPCRDFSFVVHGTCADPRFLDLSLDPSDRAVGTLWGDAWTANFAPSSLGRYASGRSWISQWSLVDSRGHGPSHLPHVTTPVQVVWGTADQAAFPEHARQLYESIGHDDKEIVAIAGANHYFIDQPDLMESAMDAMVTWARRHDLA